MSDRPVKILCEVCDEEVEVKAFGRVPKLCQAHRKIGGGKCIDHDAMNARRRKLAAKKKAGVERAPITINLSEARALAIGMLEHPTDLRHAARSAGLTLTKERLEAVAELARAEFGGIIDGDLSAFARQCQAALFSTVTKIREAVEGAEISPRDLPHAGRALAQISSIITGDDQAPRYSSIELFVTGARGNKVKLGNAKNTRKS